MMTRNFISFFIFLLVPILISFVFCIYLKFYPIFVIDSFYADRPLLLEDISFGDWEYDGGKMFRVGELETTFHCFSVIETRWNGESPFLVKPYSLKSEINWVRSLSVFIACLFCAVLICVVEIKK